MRVVGSSRVPAKALYVQHPRQHVVGPGAEKVAHDVFGGQIHEDPLPTDTELLFVSAPRAKISK
jgi:hypothetical protein